MLLWIDSLVYQIKFVPCNETFINVKMRTLTIELDSEGQIQIEGHPLLEETLLLMVNKCHQSGTTQSLSPMAHG